MSADETLDHGQCQLMAQYVEQLTTSGQAVLDVAVMKEFKKICKKSDGYVKQAYHLIMCQLEKDHAEVRLSALLMVDELFNRSHCFRNMMLANFQNFLDVTVENDPDRPLPPPKTAAKTLKSKSYESIQQWTDKYGQDYKQLSLAYSYLKNCKKVDFQDIQARSVAERRRSEEQQQRREAQQREKITKVLQEMADTKQEIGLCLTQLENCLCLLLPDPESFQLHGLKSPTTDRAGLWQISADSPNTKDVSTEKKQEINDKHKKSSQSVNGHRKNNGVGIKSSEKTTKDNGVGRKPPKSLEENVEKAAGEENIEKEMGEENVEKEAVKKNIQKEVEENVQKGIRLEPLDKEEDEYLSLFIKREFGEVPYCPSLNVNAQTKLDGPNSDKKNISENYTCKDKRKDTERDKRKDTERDKRKDTERDKRKDTERDKRKDTERDKRKDTEGDKRKDTERDKRKDAERDKRKDTEGGKKRDTERDKREDTERDKRKDTERDKRKDTDRKSHPYAGHHVASSTNLPNTVSNTCTASSGKQPCDSTNSFPMVKVKEEPLSDSETGNTSASAGDEAVQSHDLVRHHGLGSKQYSLSIELSPSMFQVEETTDNTDILQTMQDQLLLIKNKYLNGVTGWLEVMAKCGAEQHQVKSAIDIRQHLLKVLERFSHIQIKRKEKPGTRQTPCDDDEDDDDFEEVPEKEGYEPHIPEDRRSEYGLTSRSVQQPTETEWSFPRKRANSDEDPLSWQYNFKVAQKKVKQEQDGLTEAGPSRTDKEQPSTSKPVSQDDSIPHVPFGTDLLHWGEKIEKPLVVRAEWEHRFWNPKDPEDCVDQSALASMTSRVINFTGKFQPVQWKCRAPLPNGKLCERMDRIKCPFHGKIIPRDQMGNPSDHEDARRLARVKAEQEEASGSNWQDPELQADIEAATGLQLTIPKKGKGKGKGKGQKKQYPNLTDIKEKTNTTRKRLERKVLSRKAMKKVASAMNNLESRRFKDKFSNLIHYAYPQVPH